MARVRGADPGRHSESDRHTARAARRCGCSRARTMTTDRPVRLRYAPSPTGDPHVGNIRTALQSFLHARHYGGQFLVRIEDTDQGREVPGAVQRILDSL